MYFSAVVLNTLAIAGSTYATPLRHIARQGGNSSICIPQLDSNAAARSAAVSARDLGFVYGPSLIGQAGPFPNGTLGNARQAADYAAWAVDRAFIDQAIEADVGALTKNLQAAAAAGASIKTLDQFGAAFYENEWSKTNPRGVAPGVLSNYTQDSFFSMERLTQNPYPLTLVTGEIPFNVSSDIVKNLTGTDMESLKSSKKLFVADYTYQLELEKTTLEPARYGAACTGLFYIHPTSGDFLPLAIKTNVGKNLTYTPADSATDWLLAKMMFNVNDLFDAQMRHLTATHDVSESVHQAALHTMSPTHPIMLVLERFMTQAYSAQIVGQELCFNPGGHWDQLMYVDNVGCRDYVTKSWSTVGSFLGNFLTTDRRARGLIDDAGKSPFKSFPFFEDASVIHSGLEKFFTAFVDSYYASESMLAGDYEVQAWVKEATAKASVQGFPAAINKKTLVDVLTHFGHLVSTVHHTLNGGSTADSKAVMPFHMPALFAPIPEAKGVTDLMPFLPQPAQAIHYIGFVASFNRPQYSGEGMTLESAFANNTLVSQLNEKTGEAAKEFLASMQQQSKKIQARSFDKDGLSEGAPYIYRALDPGYIPFFCAV